MSGISVSRPAAAPRRVRRGTRRSGGRLLLNLLVVTAIVCGSAALGAEALYAWDASQQPKPAGVSAAPSAGWVRVRHADLMQSGAMDCAPTVAAMMLGALGVEKSVSSLAAMMHTSATIGTTPDDFMAAINALQPAGQRLVWEKVTDPAALVRDLLVDLQAGTLMPEYLSNSEIPWHSWPPGGHTVLIDGVNQGAGEVSLWDPAQTGGGEHVVSVWGLGSMLWSSHGTPEALVDLPVSR